MGYFILQLVNMADEKRNTLELIKEASSECEESFKTLYDEMEEDLKFYAGGDGQWNDELQKDKRGDHRL